MVLPRCTHSRLFLYSPVILYISDEVISYGIITSGSDFTYFFVQGRWLSGKLFSQLFAFIGDHRPKFCADHFLSPGLPFLGSFSGWEGNGRLP